MYYLEAKRTKRNEFVPTKIFGGEPLRKKEGGVAVEVFY
jgi:hypothetical protein